MRIRKIIVYSLFIVGFTLFTIDYYRLFSVIIVAPYDSDPKAIEYVLNLNFHRLIVGVILLAFAIIASIVFGFARLKNRMQSNPKP